MISNVRLAFIDLLAGIKLYDIWITLSWFDIRQRYRRSVLGPFWITLSAGITIFSMGFIYSTLFDFDKVEYVEYLAVGYICWAFISSTINEACTIFVASESMMKQIKLPLSVYLYRMLFRNILVFLHSFIVVILLLAITNDLNYMILIVPFAVLVVSSLLMNLSLVLGILGTRFRDILPLTGNAMQLLFFITPVMWPAEMLLNKAADFSWIVVYNPFYHLIELIRGPLLAGSIDHNSMYVISGFWLLTSTFAIIALASSRKHIPYWL